MSTHPVRFADLVEMIDRLPLDERESLVEFPVMFRACFRRLFGRLLAPVVHEACWFSHVLKKPPP